MRPLELVEQNQSCRLERWLIATMWLSQNWKPSLLEVDNLGEGFSGWSSGMWGKKQPSKGVRRPLGWCFPLKQIKVFSPEGLRGSWSQNYLDMDATKLWAPPEWKRGWPGQCCHGLHSGVRIRIFMSVDQSSRILEILPTVFSGWNSPRDAHWQKERTISWPSSPYISQGASFFFFLGKEEQLRKDPALRVLPESPDMPPFQHPHSCPRWALHSPCPPWACGRAWSEQGLVWCSWVGAWGFLSSRKRLQ